MMASRSRWDPDSLARLESERDLLIRELDEIDEQHRAGDFGDDDHRRLRAEVTARAAGVLRQIRDVADARPARQRRPIRAIGWIVGTATIALGAGGLLVGQLAPRIPPTPPATDVNGIDARLARLADAVAASPDDAAARLALARMLVRSQDWDSALIQFDLVATLDPSNSEALAYGGWLAELTGTDGSLDRLDAAVAANPLYADAHAFRGLVLMRSDRADEAIDAFDTYLELAPLGPMADQVRQVRTQIGGQ